MRNVIVATLLSIFHFLGNYGLAYAAAPITPSGLNTQVNLAPTPPPGKVQYDITGGTRPGGGTNLFHSFGQFNVPNNNIANFLNETGLPTSNILGRVTGGNLSSIFGTIQTTAFGNANLFLMNPAGFLFGPNATVNVGGMVAFTTADYLRLSDGVRFNAVPDVTADTLLSTAPVAAYGFLGSSPGAITVQGSQLTVADGTGISLVGGNITIQSGTPDGGGTAQPARLIAPNGTMQLASAASPGEFDAATLQALPNVNGASFTSFGSVSLAPGSNINISGRNTVSIRGGQFVLSVNDAVLGTSESIGASEAIVLSRGSSIVSSSSGAEAGPDVQLLGSNISLDGASITSLTTGDGDGGAITVTAQGNVSLTGGAQIVSRTEGNGVGGNIVVEATSPTGSVTISGYDLDGTLTGVVPTFLFNPITFTPLVASGVYSLTSGTKPGGNVTISAPSVALQDGAIVASVTSGDGRGGSIRINGGTVQILNGAEILSVAGQDTAPDFTARGTGSGGDIVISATESINISGGNLDLFAQSKIESQTVNSEVDPALGQGQGGSISLSAPIISVTDAGLVATNAFGSGAGGTINVAASNFLLVSGFSPDFATGSAIMTGTMGGNGGAINVSGSSVTIEQGSSVSTTSTSSFGNAGNVSFAVGDLTLRSAGSIASSAAAEGSSGHIQITATGDISISGNFVNPLDPGSVSWSSIRNAALGPGANGGIDIHAGRLFMSDGPQDAPPIPGQLPSDDVQIQSDTNAATGGFIRIVADESISMSTHANILNKKGSPEFGSISMAAPSISLSESAIRGQAFSSSDAGAINLTATAGNLMLSNGSRVLTSTTQGSGNGGPVTLQAANSIIISGGSIVQSESRLVATGNGGSLSLNAGDLVSLSGTGTALSAATFGQGNGGNITVQGQSVTLSDNASISANTTGQTTNAGKAGEILVKADTFSMNSGATITASSTGSGAAGGVTITGTASPAHSVLIDGTGSGIFTNTSRIGAGGNIFVNANTVTLSNGGTLSAATSGIAPSAIGGTITVTAGDVALKTGATITTATSGPGNAGNILVKADAVSMTDGATITASSAGSGAGGNVTIQGQASPAESVLIDGSGSGVFTDTSGSGAGGNIFVNANTVTLSNGGTVSAKTSGSEATATGGTVTIAASDVQLNTGGLITAQTTGAGNAGNILVKADAVSMTDGATITASSAGSGAGGNVTIQGQASPAESVLIDGSGSGVFTDTSGTGAGGNIFVNANTVTISNDGVLSATTSGSEPSALGGTIRVASNQLEVSSGSMITTQTFGPASAGQIFVTGDSIHLNTGSILADTFGDGNAGSIDMQARTISLEGFSIIGSSAFGGSGNAGSIQVRTTESLSLIDSAIVSGSFSDSTTAGNSGQIFIASPMINLNSGTFSTSAIGHGNAGAISLDTNFLTITNSGAISSSTAGEGRGGTITVRGYGGEGSSAQQISLSNAAEILTESTNADPVIPGLGHAGSITLTTNELTLSNNSRISAETRFSRGNAGNITVDANQMAIGSNSEISSRSTEGVDLAFQYGNAGAIDLRASNAIVTGGGFISTSTETNGNAGAIVLKAGNLTISDGGFITSSSVIGSAGITPRGSAGSVAIQGLAGPANAILIEGFGSAIFTDAQGTGAGGNISINANTLTLQNGGTLSAQTSGSASSASGGTIAITSANVQLNSGSLLTAQTSGAGNAGNISIKADTFSMTGGSTLTASSTGSGKAGNVTIEGTASPAQSVLIDGLGSGIFTDTQGTGAGGNIFVNANAVTLQNGGTLSAKTSGTESTATGGTITVNANQVQLTNGGLITASTTGAGAGGSIAIGADSTFASNAGTVSTTATQATGGDITITAGGVTLDNGSLITASSNGAGNAGNILINAGQSYTSTNSSVTTKADQASGGNITVLATGMVHLTNSEINASVEGSETTVGGNILIDPVYVILQNSNILAQATNGRGGNINIFYTGALLADPSSIISASSQFGQSGTVTFQSPNAPASGKIIPLGKSPLLSTTMFNQRCAALAGGDFSSFTVAGRDTLPSEPGSWLSSPLPLATVSQDKEHHARSESGAETSLLSLRQIAPPGFLTQVFATNTSDDCSS